MTNSMIDEKPKRRGWPSHSSKEGLNKELLEAGITVELTYEVRQKCDCVDAHSTGCPEWGSA